MKLTLFDHLLQRARRVDLHRVQVIEPVHFRCVFGELLAEGVGEVVCGICGLGYIYGGEKMVRCVVTTRYVWAYRHMWVGRRTMSSTDSRTAASWIAREHEVVVFPGVQ